MSRALTHEIKNVFGQGVNVAHTAFSGAATLAAPATGRHFRVYKATVGGPAALGNTVEVELRDGSANAVKHTFTVAAQGVADLDLGSRYLRFDNDIALTRGNGQNDEVFISVFYTEQP